MGNRNTEDNCTQEEKLYFFSTFLFNYVNPFFPYFSSGAATAVAMQLLIAVGRAVSQGTEFSTTVPHSVS